MKTEADKKAAKAEANRRYREKKAAERKAAAAILGIPETPAEDVADEFASGKPLNPLPAKAKTKAERAKKPRKESKQDKAIAMMRRKTGASGSDLAAAFGWQPHTVRGFIAAACKKKLGLNIVASKEEQRGTVYRIV